MRANGLFLRGNKPNIPSGSRSFFTLVQQYQKGVTFTLGKVTSVKEPGIRILIPFVQDMFKIDMRTRVVELPSQDIFTKDNVSTRVNAIICFRVLDPQLVTLEVTDVDNGIHQLVQGHMRDSLSSKDFSEILNHRDAISRDIMTHTSNMATKWGVLLEKVQLKNVDIVDPNMIRAMAKEAEATRDKIAAIIRADGELQASKKLVEAADMIRVNPVALELRRLQTLEKISKEKSQHTVIVPMDFGGQSSAVMGMAFSKAHEKKDEQDKPFLQSLGSESNVAH